jgi:nucleoside-diphosphate-sugar epimerase
VHADDLAKACLAVMDHSTTYEKAYNLSGGEILSYRDMIIRIFLSLKQKPILITIPLPLFRTVISLLKIKFHPLMMNALIERKP